MGGTEAATHSIERNQEIVRSELNSRSGVHLFTTFFGAWDDFAAFVINSKFLNVPFVAGIFGAIPGALFGAWAGARAARRISERAKLKEQLSEELKSTNRAIIIAFGICNKVIGLKGQHIRPLKQNFESSKKAFQEAINGGGQYRFWADLQTLTPVSLPARALEGTSNNGDFVLRWAA